MSDDTRKKSEPKELQTPTTTEEAEKLLESLSNKNDKPDNTKNGN